MNIAIVAGGRDFMCKEDDLEWLKTQFLDNHIDTVYSGHCPTGADQTGEYVARKMELKIRLFPPDWHTFGKSAGPRRNEEMAVSASKESSQQAICILFPGGKGTDNMRKNAVKYGLKIIEKNKDCA